MADLARHNINVNNTAKEVSIVLEGAFDDQATQSFLVDFNSEMNKITPSEYLIVFDASKFTVMKQEMLPVLEGCFKLYKELNFKKINMILNNPILNLQVKRVAKMSGLDNFDIIA